MIAFYGVAQGGTARNGGTLCVSGPKKRLPVSVFDGAGSVSFAFPVGLCVVGDVVFCQGWFRDPAHPDGTTVGLTNGLRVEFCP